MIEMGMGGACGQRRDKWSGKVMRWRQAMGRKQKSRKLQMRLSDNIEGIEGLN